MDHTPELGERGEAEGDDRPRDQLWVFLSIALDHGASATRLPGEFAMVYPSNEQQIVLMPSQPLVCMSHADQATKPAESNADHVLEKVPGRIEVGKASTGGVPERKGRADEACLPAECWYG